MLRVLEEVSILIVGCIGALCFFIPRLVPLRKIFSFLKMWSYQKTNNNWHQTHNFTTSTLRNVWLSFSWNEVTNLNEYTCNYERNCVFDVWDWCFLLLHPKLPLNWWIYLKDILISCTLSHPKHNLVSSNYMPKDLFFELPSSITSIHLVTPVISQHEFSTPDWLIIKIWLLWVNNIWM